MRRHERRFPRLGALHEAVAARPRIAAYLASERRLPFSEEGIFRRYPELDLQPPARAATGEGARRSKTAGKAGATAPRHRRR
jgi:glutathione S-transferase